MILAAITPQSAVDPGPGAEPCARRCRGPGSARRSTSHSRARPWAATILLALVALAGASAAFAASDVAAGSASGLPVPRFVSLKPDRVNVRSGPTRDHDVAFMFTRPALPVEITAESDNWRRIRDWEGSEGWVYHSLLSGRRTALVAPKDKNQLVPLYEQSDANSAVVAQLQAGVQA